jgi:hypothetical protein
MAMRSSFFRRVWRFNAIVIALLGLVGLALGAMALIVFGNQSASEGVSAFPTKQPAKLGATVYGELQPVPETSFAVFSVGRRLVDDVDPSSMRFDKGYDQSVIREENLLIINLKSGETRFALPNNKRRIIKWEIVGSDADGSRAPVGTYAVLVADEAESKPARFDILIGNTISQRQAWVAKGVDAYDLPTVLDANTFTLLTTKDGKASLLKISLPDFSVVSIPLPLVPPSE